MFFRALEKTTAKIKFYLGPNLKGKSTGLTTKRPSFEFFGKRMEDFDLLCKTEGSA